MCLTNVAVLSAGIVAYEGDVRDLEGIEKNVGVVVGVHSSVAGILDLVGTNSSEVKLEVVEELEPELLVSTKLFLSGLIVSVHQTE